jgi:hypothetical protein
MLGARDEDPYSGKETREMKAIRIHQYGCPGVNSETLTQLARLVDEGAVKINVEKTFPLEQAAAALVQLEKKPPRRQICFEGHLRAKSLGVKGGEHESQAS